MIRVGQRVSVRDKDVEGVVAYVGMTEFAPGKWIGVALGKEKPRDFPVKNGF